MCFLRELCRRLSHKLNKLKKGGLTDSFFSFFFLFQDNEIDLRMLIHQSLAGCVIGKGGSKIKELRDVSNSFFFLLFFCCSNFVVIDNIIYVTFENNEFVINNCNNDDDRDNIEELIGFTFFMTFIVYSID